MHSPNRADDVKTTSYVLMCKDCMHDECTCAAGGFCGRCDDDPSVLVPWSFALVSSSSLFRASIISLTVARERFTAVIDCFTLLVILVLISHSRVEARSFKVAYQPRLR
jgi:hypothetical protein